MYAPLSPTALVATLEPIRSWHFRLQQRQPLIDAGFDWTGFDARLAAVERARVGYTRGQGPIRVILDDDDKRAALEPVLSGLEADLVQLRELGPKVFGGAEQIGSRIRCTVPNGTEHFELREADPEQVYVITLQDAAEFIHEELPHLGRMTRTWALYLFGDGLSDWDLGEVDFAAMNQLRLLDLAENRLTRVPERVLACTQLESLSLARNPDLRSLTVDLGRLTKLRRLDLAGTAVDEQDVAAVASALPDCVIHR